VALTVTLEPVDATSREAFFALARDYHAELDAFEVDARPWDFERWRAATLDDMEGRELLWIVRDGRRAGFALTRTLPDWPDESRMVCTIAEFYVVPAERRRGTGRAAVLALLAEHRRRGTSEVEAGILHRNAPALAFWEALGFRPHSVITTRRP
jgi:ribosomal protein S18 acetylase RimI-like enzyme